jgi:hypothetical protein
MIISGRQKEIARNGNLIFSTPRCKISLFVESTNILFIETCDKIYRG